MKIKFPLEMKDGFKVRTLEELKQHFDLENVLVYLLNGKLLTWLELRYYDDEAMAIKLLNINAPQLHQKLCDIFNVDLPQKNDINIEDISHKQSRILKIKQYTDDKRLITQEENFAFNQEDLENLYKHNKTTIYLCEGTFEIPEDKCELDYVIVGKPNVHGLNSQKMKFKQFIGERLHNIKNYKIPVGIADDIQFEKYIQTKNYFIVLSKKIYFINSKIIVINKKTKEKKSIAIPIGNIFSKFLLLPLSNSECLIVCYTPENEFLLESYNFNCCDLTFKKIELNLTKSINNKELIDTYKNNLILFGEKDNNVKPLVMYNFKTKATLNIDNVKLNSNFLLDKNIIYYSNDKQIKAYNIDTHQYMDICQLVDIDYKKIELMVHENKLCCFIEGNNYTKIFIINMHIKDSKKEVFCSNKTEYLIRKNDEYFIFSASKGDSLYSLNLEQEKIDKIDSECNYELTTKYSFSLVENYLYYYQGKNRERLIRYDLKNNQYTNMNS